MDIAIIECSNFYRGSLKTALNQIDDVDVVFDSDNLNSFLQSAKECICKIILIDSCIYQNENIKMIFNLLPEIKILVLSNFIEKCFFENAITNNSIDFISKSSNKCEFEQKIRKLLNFEIESIK